MNRISLPAILICVLLSDVVASDSAVTITRDKWGVPHIHGRTHADAFFGMGYAQAEDYFWQLEDTCIHALGRYSEVAGKEGVRSDILNRSFEIVRRAQEDFETLPPEHQELTRAFVGGINRFLETHPDEKPRLISHFEPWYALAIDRHSLLEFTYRLGKIGKPENRQGDDVAAWNLTPEAEVAAWDIPIPARTEFEEEIQSAIGSNAWAISGSRTKSGAAMLFINPHQPWYGMGQFYEAHVHSDAGLNFTGACFYGTPFPTLGHNEHLGWAYTVNEPDNTDVWEVSFDDDANPLNYRYDGGHRTATQWQETLKVKKNDEFVDQTVTFRKTHHGPVVRAESDGTLLCAQVAGLFDTNRFVQGWGMVNATNYGEWRAAISHCAIPMFNVVYADKVGNIFYAYNGTIPRRDPQFDWTRPVDGSNPATEWQGIHSFDELPQVFNPDAGYVQSCNSTPYTTTDTNNPTADNYPAYMMMDADVDMRRSKLSRMILGNTKELTFDQLQNLAYDTRLYWPLTEIPKLADDYERLQKNQPDLAESVAPYWQHLNNWDFRSTVESTQTTLTLAWYEELYGLGYPAETLKPEYQDRLTWFKALKKAAGKVQGLYGDWKHPWGQAHRLQRIADQSDVLSAGVRLNPIMKSLPCAATPGPLGIVFTVYSSPEIPFIRPQRFAVVGASYTSVVEFGERIEATSIVPFGASGRRKSPHFFDQAELFCQQKLKPAPFYRDEVAEFATESVSLDR
jgi:acyl-homoserine-lactone acylase